MKEIWKDIPNHPKYKISNTGKVMSYKTKTPTLLIPQSCTDKNPRLRVKLSDNGVSKRYYIHRLMMLTFYPKENSDNLEVNHIDGNPQNNNLENLEWVTSKENQKHYKEKLIPKRKENNTFNVGVKPNPIRIIFTNGIINYYLGFNEVANDLKVSRSTINRWRTQPPKEIQSIEIIDRIPDNYNNKEVKIEKHSIPHEVKISFYGEKEPLTFSNCCEADKYFNLSKGTIQRWWTNIDKEKRPNKLNELNIKYIEKI